MSISDEDLLKVASRGRKRFKEEQIEEALVYMVNNPQATIDETARHFGMTAQTLSTRKRKLLAARGIVPGAQPVTEEPAKQPTKPSTKTKKK